MEDLEVLRASLLSVSAEHDDVLASALTALEEVAIGGC
jgi:hypothetical protein